MPSCTARGGRRYVVVAWWLVLFCCKICAQYLSTRGGGSLLFMPFARFCFSSSSPLPSLPLFPFAFPSIIIIPSFLHPYLLTYYRSLFLIIYNNIIIIYYFVCVCAYVRARTMKQGTKKERPKSRSSCCPTKPIKYKSRFCLFSKRLPRWVNMHGVSLPPQFRRL